MIKKKLLLALGILLTFSVLATACSSGSGTSGKADSSKKLKFGFSIMQLDNPYFVAVNKGFSTECKKYGIEYSSVDAKYDVAKQKSDIENMIQKGDNAIMIAPIDQNAVKDVVAEAKSKGILVLSIAQPIDTADINYVVDEYQYGVANGTNAANWINQKLGGKADVIIISQDNVQTVIQRGNGVEDTIKKLCPNAKIVARQAGDTAEKGMSIVENVMQRDPNVKVVIGVNDSGALGGLQAVKSMGKATSDFYVGGADADAEAIATMKDPNSIYRATLDLQPYNEGIKAADLMKQYVAQGAPKQSVKVLFTWKAVLQQDVVSGAYKPVG